MRQAVEADAASCPQVSIVMPAHNAAACLGDSIQSVLDQSLGNWELIVVNDGSRDGTRDFLDALQDPRIRVVHQPNAGVSAARNAALEIARGEFLTFLDADDVLPPDSLETRVRYLVQHADVDIVDGTVEVRDSQLQRVVRVREPGAAGSFFPRLIRLDASVFFGIVVMLRRSAVSQLRFRPGMTHCEDLLFLLQAADGRDWRYGSVQRTVYVYRHGGTSAMANLDGLERGYLSLFEACRQLREPTADDLDYLYRRIRRILVRSWLRRGRPERALGAWRRLAGRRA
jgi:teichuronic acid biosynthesis glycosyltransferase TuaG